MSISASSAPTIQVQAGIIGYPNIGKSSLINRLLKRWMCPAAPRPGVTRTLKISDQSAAIKLAICDDIGERSHHFADVAAILVQILSRLPEADSCASWQLTCSTGTVIKQPSVSCQTFGKRNLAGFHLRDLLHNAKMPEFQTFLRPSVSPVK